jgi:hypothetical protein
MPNYITRSKIDFIPEADTYGPMTSQHGNKYTSVIHEIADDEWTSNSINFRNEMQERLMRKINANAWQQKIAPINKGMQKK